MIVGKQVRELTEDLDVTVTVDIYKFFQVLAGSIFIIDPAAVELFIHIFIEPYLIERGIQAEEHLLPVISIQILIQEMIVMSPRILDPVLPHQKDPFRILEDIYFLRILLCLKVMVVRIVAVLKALPVPILVAHLYIIDIYSDQVLQPLHHMEAVHDGDTVMEIAPCIVDYNVIIEWE